MNKKNECYKFLSFFRVIKKGQFCEKKNDHLEQEPWVYKIIIIATLLAKQNKFYRS